jgi:hypothetical protein
MGAIHNEFINRGYDKYWPKASAAIKEKTNVGSSASVYIPVHS